MTNPGGLLDLRRALLGDQPEVGLQGFPQLKTSEIIRPTEYSLIESAYVFTELEVKRAVRLWVPNQRRILRAVPHRLPDSGANVISRGLYIPSVNGILDLLAPGVWLINTPIVTAEGTSVTALYSDSAFAVAALNEAAGEDPNSFMALYAARVFSAGAVAAVGVATATVIAANSSRRFVYVKNVSTGGQRITLSFGGSAVLDQGMTLQVGEWRAFDALTGISQANIDAIASAAGAALEYITGT